MARLQHLGESRYARVKRFHCFSADARAAACSLLHCAEVAKPISGWQLEAAARVLLHLVRPADRTASLAAGRSLLVWG
ncbi:hypothetical protein [Gimesia aquarii]|uniref:hypothetical protein n=1 Tax=Gimesia aquarii TaxID=2527964 RepID=UPI0011A0D0A4|nr:hypothetical protein [Gimesia aquarii]